MKLLIVLCLCGSLSTAEYFYDSMEDLCNDPTYNVVEDPLDLQECE